MPAADALPGRTAPYDHDLATLPERTEPSEARSMPRTLRPWRLLSEICMPAAGPNPRYAAPLTPAERQAIPEAVTIGGRTQRAIIPKG